MKTLKTIEIFSTKDLLEKTLKQAMEESLAKQFPGKKACCVITMCKCVREIGNTFECNCHKENPHGV